VGDRALSPAALERAALRHLSRYSSSRGNLRRVLLRWVDRQRRRRETEVSEPVPEVVGSWIDELLDRLEEARILDDRQYAEDRARSLVRRGVSERAVRNRLADKGLPESVVDVALDALREAHGDLDLVAACVHARRRRLGPYRAEDERALQRERDLGTLARAGFPYPVAKRVLEAESTELLASWSAELLR
jgi:regulatory protein